MAPRRPVDAHALARPQARPRWLVIIDSCGRDSACLAAFRVPLRVMDRIQFARACVVVVCMFFVKRPAALSAGPNEECFFAVMTLGGKANHDNPSTVETSRQSTCCPPARPPSKSHRQRYPAISNSPLWPRPKGSRDFHSTTVWYISNQTGVPVASSSVEREGRGSQPSRLNLERLRPPPSRQCCRLPQTGPKYAVSTTSSFLFLVHHPLLPMLALRPGLS